MEAENIKKIKKLELLQREPNLAFLDELTSVNDKLEALRGVLSDINNKELESYGNQLETLISAISDLEKAVNIKDLVVNIPLDDLASKIASVETAIKNIKPVSIPEYPSEMALSDIQINELLLAIQSIPEFPVKDLEKMFKSLGDKIESSKSVTPTEKEEFDYDRLEKKLNEVIKAVKNVSITVSGGGGIDEVSRQNLTNISNNTSSISGLNIPTHDYIAATYPTTSQEVYTYKVGGASGTIVGVITVNYQDATKVVLLSVVKS